MRKHRKFGDSALRALGARPIRANLGRYAPSLISTFNWVRPLIWYFWARTRLKTRQILNFPPLTEIDKGLVHTLC
jgi:hypothetical protein